MFNNYDKLYTEYAKTDVKPDKYYSILPTVIMLAGKLNDKIVVDLGCGSGFFTRELATRNPRQVIGLDNSQEQIKQAHHNKKSEIEHYIVHDIFEDRIPESDVTIAPFVLNYAESKDQLYNIFKKIYMSLKDDGFIVGVIDLPSGKDLTRFGAKKEFIPGTNKIQNHLFDGNGNKLVTLNAYYYGKEVVSEICSDIGFAITWHDPIISEEGKKELGEDFWEGYIQNPELGYFVARK